MLNTTINKYTSFEFVEEKYAEIVNLIYGNYKGDTFKKTTYCPPHFILSLVYNSLPTENVEEMIKDIFETMKANPFMFKLSYEELIMQPQIVQFLENKYYFSTDDLYVYSESQQCVLRDYFNEALSEVEYRIMNIL